MKFGSLAKFGKRDRFKPYLPEGISRSSREGATSKNIIPHWRNGRREGFRSLSSNLGIGSSPICGTHPF